MDGDMVLRFRGGSPCLCNAKELEKTHATFLPRTLLAISCAIVLTSAAANCRSSLYLALHFPPYPFQHSHSFLAGLVQNSFTLLARLL